MTTTIIQITPINSPLFAVFNVCPGNHDRKIPTKPEHLETMPCLCLALCEHDDKGDVWRSVTPFVCFAEEGDVSDPTHCSNFLGFATSKAEARKLYVKGGAQ